MGLAVQNLSAYLQAQIEGGAFPSAQYVIGERGTRLAEDALGQAVVEPEPIAASRDTIYDLASLTKPLVTALLVMIFAERGGLDLDAPIATYLQEFKANHPHPDFTLKQLLTHTSGLPAWAALYNQAATRQEVPAIIARLADETARTQDAPPVVYSDLNFILLGFLLERLNNLRLDALAHKEIFAPLALTRTMFNPPRKCREEIAATEHGRWHERLTVDKQGWRERAAEAALPSQSEPQADPSSPLPVSLSPRHPFIPSQTWGEVHDGNAYFLDGVAGHAGLFSTAREVFQIANQFLPGSKILKPVSLGCFSENLTRGRGDARSIGWMLAETPNASAAASFSPTAFGHTGFTGTSVWIDPVTTRIVVLLTNRVHPKIGDPDMKSIRQRFNSMADQYLLDRR